MIQHFVKVILAYWSFAGGIVSAAILAPTLFTRARNNPAKRLAISFVIGPSMWALLCVAVFSAGVMSLRNRIRGKKKF